MAGTTLAAVATWLATLGGFTAAVAFPVAAAALWGLSRRDGVFLCIFFLVLAVAVIFVLAAGMIE